MSSGEVGRSANDLRDLLAQVHTRLKGSGSVDPEAQELLKTVMGDIERALGGAPLGAPTASGGVHASRLESLAVQFEADHPALAGLLRRVIDTLGKAGI